MKLSKPRLRKYRCGDRWICFCSHFYWFGKTPEEAYKGWVYIVGAGWVDQYKAPPNGGTPYWCNVTTYHSGERVRFGDNIYELMYNLNGTFISSTNDVPNKRSHVWLYLGSYELYQEFREGDYTLPVRPYLKDSGVIVSNPDYKQTGLAKLINWFKGWWK